MERDTSLSVFTLSTLKMPTTTNNKATAHQPKHHANTANKCEPLAAPPPERIVNTLAKSAQVSDA